MLVKHVIENLVLKIKSLILVESRTLAYVERSLMDYVKPQEVIR